MKLLTEKDVKAIESVLAKGDHVEIIPVKDGIKIIEVRIKIIEVKRKVIKPNNSKPAPDGAEREESSE